MFGGASALGGLWNARKIQQPKNDAGDEFVRSPACSTKAVGKEILAAEKPQQSLGLRLKIVERLDGRHGQFVNDPVGLRLASIIGAGRSQAVQEDEFLTEGECIGHPATSPRTVATTASGSVKVSFRCHWREAGASGS